MVLSELRRQAEEVPAEFYQHGSFICIDGPAKKAGGNHSNMKVCFSCTDIEFLRSLLIKVGQDKECYWVKMSTNPRDGMYLGRCFFTESKHAANLWAKYKAHPKLMASLQDDDFVSNFREKVFSWKGKPENALE
jgi:hypothetical protein